MILSLGQGAAALSKGLNINSFDQIEGHHDVDRLLVLPLKKSIEISFNNLRVRFFRSLITTVTLVLAVSFLAFVRVSTDIGNGLLSTNDPSLRQELLQAGYDLSPEDKSLGSNPKHRWIIILSLLVCTVGIINAQLMAVTERFREIGTMKCLGALDHFILRLFFLEAGMQGLAGAAAGAIIGTFFSLFNGLINFGTISLVFISWKDVVASIIFSIIVGLFLSLLGVMYPAIIAAKMQPVEAMRIEE